MKRNLRIILGVALGVITFWLAVRKLDLLNVVEILSDADLFWLFGGILVQLMALYTRGKRWQLLLGLKGQFIVPFRVMNIGYLVNNILPFRIGEIVRPVLISRRTDRTFVQGGATILVERALDIMIVVLMLFFILPMMDVPIQISRSASILSVIFFGLLFTLFLPLRFQSALNRAIRSVSAYTGKRITSWLISIVDQLAIGLRLIIHPRAIITLLFWSMLSWILSLGLYYCVLRAFQSDAGFVEAAFMVVTLTFSMTIPSSPGYIGVFEYVGQQALMLPFGSKYDLATAFSVAFSVHMVFVIITSIFGMIAISRMSLSVEEIMKQSLKINHKDAPPDAQGTS